MAIGLMIKSVILAAQFSGRKRKRSLKRLSKMNADEKDKEILFLRQGPSAADANFNPAKRAEKERNQQSLYAWREALHSALRGNLSDRKA